MQVSCDSGAALIRGVNSLFANPYDPRVNLRASKAGFVRAVAHALDMIQYPLHDTKVNYPWSLKATAGLCLQKNKLGAHFTVLLKWFTAKMKKKSKKVCALYLCASGIGGREGGALWHIPTPR